MKKLDYWFVSWASDDPFLAPEARLKRLCGVLDGHEVTVMLVPPLKIEGRIIKLSTGECVELGEREPDYADFMARHNLPYDEANPIKTVEQYTSLVEEPRRGRH